MPGIGAHPVADPDNAGVAALPAAEFSLSMAALDESGNQAGLPASGEVATVSRSNFAVGEACVTIELDMYRGGVVGDSVADVTVPAACVEVAVAECMKATHPHYANWVRLGRPDAWCYQYQCRGDADGKSQGGGFGQPFYPVGSDDINVLVAAFEVPEADIDTIVVNGVPGIAADFTHYS